MRLIAFVLLCLVTVRLEAAEELPLTHEEYRAEVRRIRTEFKGDLPRLTEELNKLTRRRAREKGTEAQLDARIRLREKYGPAFHMSEVFASQGKPGLMIDHGAWKLLVGEDGHELVLSLFLDKARYKDAEPKNVKVQLRRKGKTAADEERLAKGWSGSDTFRIALSTEETNGGIYVARVVIPMNDRKDYMIDVSAEIEPGWATLSSLPLR